MTNDLGSHLYNSPLKGMLHDDADLIAQAKPLDPPAQDEVEVVARALAKSHGVDFDEPCGMGEDGDGDCDSSTCVAASFEDHDVDYARQYYRGLATAAIAALDQHRGTDAQGGWIVSNGDQTQWRTWGPLGPDWTVDRDQATRYARRQDAELAHAEDLDAWSIVPYGPVSGDEALREENVRLREALENAAHAIDEMFRYFDGGETRGSYDGKPERAQLRKAGYAVRAALTRRQG